MPLTQEDRALAFRLFSDLGQTVEDCAHKLRGMDLLIRVCTDGLDIRVGTHTVSNHQLVTWRELADHPGMLALRCGMAAGEAISMQDHRNKRRRNDDV